MQQHNNCLDKSTINKVKEKIIQGNLISKEEALNLVRLDTEELCKAANEIRKHFCKNHFDLCGGKTGRMGNCSEDCKFCIQSSHYNGQCKCHPMITYEDFKEDAIKQYEMGVNRFGIASAGKRITDKEVDLLCDSFKKLKKDCNIAICGYGGMLPYDKIVQLKEAGVTRYHNNLETSRRFFKNICTTHTYDEKLKTLNYAKQAGLEICSGCILGVGEKMSDRIELAFELQNLEVDSVPINILTPRKGTPLENADPLPYDEILKTVAIFRFILPKAEIRMAAGRILLEDGGKKCFESGANATLIGDMITVKGISPEKDIEMAENFL